MLEDMDLELEEPVEVEAEEAGERQNRTFIILVAVMGGLLLIGILAFCVWMFTVGRGVLTGGRAAIPPTAPPEEAILAAAETATAEAALALTPVSPEPTATPTPSPTPVPPSPTRPPTIAAHGNARRDGPDPGSYLHPHRDPQPASPDRHRGLHGAHPGRGPAHPAGHLPPPADGDRRAIAQNHPAKSAPKGLRRISPTLQRWV